MEELEVPRFSTELRVGRGLRPGEVERRLLRLSACRLNAPASDREAIDDPAWNHYYSKAVIAVEPPGPPEAGGAFEHACALVTRYEFSDPRIVVGYFDPEAPLLERPMLLELKVLGLRYVCGVSVQAVRDERTDACSIFGYRYDTFEGHLEAGSEWFLVSKDHATGEVRFLIQATWKEGQFPNWWSRLGFRVLGRPYQRAWHRLAHLRLRRMLRARDLPPLPYFGRLLREGRAVPAPPVARLARRTRPPNEVQEERESGPPTRRFRRGRRGGMSR